MSQIQKQSALTLLVPMVLGLFSNASTVMAVTDIGNDITSNGNLTIDGALKFASGAVNNYLLKTDAAGNATWTSVGTALGNATTDNLPQGAINQYFTNAAADARITLQKGMANGLATLDAGGQIPAGQIPALAINNTNVVADIAGRNALTPNVGDVAIVTDAGSGESRSYIWDGLVWIELLTPLNLYLSKANNLSDLANVPTARTNLGLGAGDSPTMTGLTLTGLTSGSLMFTGVGGVVSQDNANLFWDDINNRLGIKTDVPAYTLDVAGDIKAGDGSRVILGSKLNPDPAGVNGAMYYNSTTNKFRCFENGVWMDCISTLAASTLSSLTAAIAANSINNGDNPQIWNWSLTTAGQKGLTLGENVASTATGDSSVLHVSTLTSSLAMPLFVENLGDGNSFRVNDSSGDLTPFLISETGHVAIGSNSFDPVNPEKLKVDSGSDPSFNIITATGNLNNYLQMNIKNRNSGANASSDIVATADNGDENNNYIDMGINSSGYSNPAYSIGGPDDGYLVAQGGDLGVGTGAAGTVIKFHTGGTTAADERMRIDGTGLVGIATTTPGSELDVKGTLRLSGATSGYVGFAPAAVAGSTTYTLPAADGTAGQALVTDGTGTLNWASATSVWQRIGTVLSPLTAGDDITTSGDISTSGTGTMTSAGLLTGNAGAAISGADTNINVNSNFNTNINTGTSTGALSIGNNLAGAINITSGSSLSIAAGAASSLNTTAGDISLQPAGTATSANVQIGSGGAGSATPDLLALDVKSTAGDPAGFSGAMYFNANSDTFRCFDGGWTNCSAAFLDTLIAATTAHVINNGDNAQTWNWSLTTADKKAFTFGENAASTATGAPAILAAKTMTSSTAMPLFVENLGDGNSFRVDDSSGDVSPFLINENGNVAIGTTSFDPVNPEKLKVEAGTTTSPSVIIGAGDRAGSLYTAIRNRNSGATASSAFAAVADDGNTSSNFMAVGIASSGFANPAYTIAGPHDAYLFNVGNLSGTQGGNMLIGTIEPGMSVKFLTGGGATPSNEKMRINPLGNVGIGTTAPGSKLDVKGELRLSGATSGYVGLAPAAVAGATTYTLPAADGTAGQVLSTDGAGIMSWTNAGSMWQKIGTIISPVTAGDAVTTSGNIYTSGTGTITSAGLLTGNAGATISGAVTSINDNSNFNTTINTGTSTGTVTIGNAAAGAIGVTSGAALNLTGGAASSLGTTSGDITLQPAGTGTTGNVQIGAGGVGSATPDLLALDLKSTAGDPASGLDGAMYYNESEEKFKCHINGSWGDCDTTGGTATLQSVYNAGATITTSAATDIALTLTSGNFTAAGAGSVNLTPTGASSFTSGGALTLTGGAASTWGTSAGDLTLQAAGSGTAANVKIGAGGAGSTTPDLFAVDVKSTTGDPLGGYNGAMYYNQADAVFRCYEAGGWKNCGSSAASATTLQQAYTAGPTITTAGSTDLSLLLSSGNLTASGAGSVNLTPTGASSFTSGGALTLTGGAASTWGTTAGNLNLQTAGSGTTANVQIGSGVASATPDRLVLDQGTADPAGTAGAMYYNTVSSRFRCYEAGAWVDCGANAPSTTSLQNAYANGATITTAGATNVALTLTSGDFTASGAGSVNLTPTGASSFTSGGALTLTGGAASTWGTTAGNLNLQTAGSGTTANVQIGSGVASATPDRLVLDQGTADPAGTNGAMYYNTVSNSFRCYENGSWGICNIRSIGLAKGDLIAFTAASTPVRLPVGTNSQVLISDSTQATGLRWSDLSIANNSIDFAQIKDLMTVDANTSINLAGNNLIINDLTGGGALSLSTNAAALTLTAGAASNWTTTAGALTIDAGTTTPAPLNLGTSGANAINMGKAGVTVTSVGPLQTGNAANTGSLRIADGSTNFITLTSPAIAADYSLTLPVDDGTANQFLKTDGSGVLSWSNPVTTPMTTEGDMVYYTTGAPARLPIGVVGTVLRSNGTDPVWTALTNADVGLGNVTNDAQLKQSIGTAKGDLITYTASNTPVRLPVGSNGQVLIADSTQASGLLWANSSVTNNSIDFAQLVDNMTVDANTSINLAGQNLTINDLTGGGALSFTTNAAALTLTAGAASTWRTSSGALTIDSATNLNLGTANATGITIGKAGTVTNNIGTLLIGNSIPGVLKLSDGLTHSITLTSPAIASSYTLTLPVDDGTSGQVMTTDGSGNLSWSASTNYWNRAGTILSPATSGDSITTSGNVSTTGTGTITSAGLLTATSGVTVGPGQSYTGIDAVTLSSAAASGLTINSGTTGALNIGTDASSETINIGTGAAIKNLTFGSTNTTSSTLIQSGTNNITLDAAGTGTTGTVQIGTGGAGNTTPDLLGLAVKSTTGDPVGGAEGQIYYNTFDNVFRCFQNAGWTNCVGGGSGTVTSVDGSGGTTGLTLTGGPITTTGTLTLGGTLGIANGGTNSSSTPTSGAVAYGTGTAYAFSAAGTAGQVLRSAGAATPTWANASTLVTGTLTQSAVGANKGTQVTATATCAAGRLVLGGGGQTTTSDGANLFRAVMQSSYPSATNTWTVVGVVSDSNLGGSQRLNVTAYALCSP